MSKLPHIAVLDLGSNSFHGCVFSFSKIDGLSQIDSYKKVLRFASVIEAEGLLGEKDMEQGILTIKTFKDLAETNGAVMRAVATHAIRNSRNFEDFLKKVEREAHVKVEIIDGKEEGRMAYLGMQAGLDLQAEPILGVDLGGGSTELIFARENKLTHLSSLNMGTVSMHNRFIRGVKSQKSQQKKAVKKLKDYLVTKLFPVGIDMKKIPIERALASSGTAKALAYMDHFLRTGKDLDEVNGYELKTKGLLDIEAMLCKLWSPDKIAQHFQIDPKRAEIILAGTLIYLGISDLFGIKKWTISTYGFREGVALDWYAQHYNIAPANFRDFRYKSVYNFGEKYGIEKSAALQTAALSLEIFNKLKPIYKDRVGEMEDKALGELVTAGAFLHEAGKWINPPSYHKHSYYVLSEGALLGYSHKERHLIALMIRFSRKKPARSQKAKKKPYLKENLDLVNLMSSSLRIAKIFSRKRPMSLKTIDFRVREGVLEICVAFFKENSLVIEKQLLAKEEAFLAEALGYDIRVHVE